MQKFLNDPERFVDEMLEGYRLAHPDQVEAVDGEPRAIVAHPRPDGRVAIATGGGSMASVASVSGPSDRPIPSPTTLSTGSAPT